MTQQLISHAQGIYLGQQLDPLGRSHGKILFVMGSSTTYTLSVTCKNIISLIDLRGINIFHIFNGGCKILKINILKLFCHASVRNVEGECKSAVVAIGNQHNNRVHKRLITNSPLNIAL